MNLLKKISQKIGFTETEAKIVLFLLITFLVGIIVSTIKNNNNNSKLLEFNYDKEDSAFYNVSFYTDTADSIEKNTQKRVESQSELSDFRTAEKEEKKGTVSFSTITKLDINKAGLNEFASLPGIGLKTAQSIIDYRQKNGRFEKIDELLKIKGIGKAKFEKIKNFITVNK